MTKAPPSTPHAAPFLTTRWTCVGQAKADSEEGRRALADLCGAYYEPVVACLRSVLRDVDAAREMSHAFFAEMLAGGTIHPAERGRGRFRSYLLGAVKHFVGHQRVAARRMMDDAEVADARVLPPDAELDPHKVTDGSCFFGRRVACPTSAAWRGGLPIKCHPTLTPSSPPPRQARLPL
ncbi:MAG: hypothetical protein ABMA01_05585 [Chthoniobacteraceae bacterium]